MKFAPLCKIDYTLAGRPGSTITLPSFAYIGDATVVAEGADIPISQLTASTAQVSVKKLGKGVELTDEAVLNGYGDPVREASSQLGLAIASALDNDVLKNVLGGVGSSMTHEITGALSADGVADAEILFGEDIDDGPKYLFISSAQYAALKKNKDSWVPASEVAADIAIKGTVGMVGGCVVVVSNKIKKDASTHKTTNYIVKPGALALYLKRDVEIETDRDIVAKTTVMTGDKHYAAYLYDASKAIKIVCTETA